MAGGFPLAHDVCNAVMYGTVGSFPPGTAISPSATPNTKGSYTQIVASTTQDCSLLEIDLWGRPASTDTCGAVDIAIGAGGSEQIILPNLSMWIGDAHSLSSRIQVPFNIPSGTRISARMQTNGTTAATAAAISVRTYDSAFQNVEGCGDVEVCGFNTTTTLGTAITPNASGGVKGSYSQLIASTSFDYTGLFYLIDTQNNGTIGDSYQIDIAIGAGGSEVVIVPNLAYWASDTTYGNNGGVFVPINVPAGSRISARCAAAGVSEPAIGITVYGVSL